MKMFNPLPTISSVSLLWVCLITWFASPQAIAQCDQTIVADTLVADYSGTPVDFCIDLNYLTALNGQLFIDGVLQTSMPDGCDFDTLTYYSYGTFPDGGQNGPYNLQSWMINGAPVSSSFNTIADLVNFMNATDPAAMWMDDQLTGNIVGGTAGTSYGMMVVEQINTGRTRNVRPNSQAVANGTVVTIGGAGYHEVIIDDSANSGCRDTLTVFLDLIINDRNLNITTDFNTVSDLFCLNNTSLPGTPQAYSICNAPSNGTLTDEGSYCFRYTPDLNYVGNDVVCFDVCDNTPGPGGPFCQRTIVNITTQAPITITTDTLRFNMTNTDTVVCFNALIQTPAPRTASSLCAPATAGISATPDVIGCLTIEPQPSFSGEATFCVQHCNGAICDTTIVIATVASSCNLDIFTTDQDSISSNGNPTAYCISIAFADQQQFLIELDGQPYLGPFDECNFEQLYFYNYGALFNRGNSGPYTLLSWDVNGNTTSGSFQDPAALELFMQSFDPTGSWRLNAAGFSIQGGNINNTYGDMRIVHDATGTITTLSPNPIDIALGTSVSLPGDGSYVLSVTETATGCSDEITVVVGITPTITTTTQTITVPVTANSSSDLTCLFTTPRDTFSLCGDVTNGVSNIDANFCVVYTPEPGFIGNDTLCAVSCDLPGATVCDTTYLIFQVSIVPDTIYLSNFGNSPFDACAILPFAGPYQDATLCGVFGPAVASAGQMGCIIIDPDDDTAGQLSVCAEICQQANPLVCQQIIFIVEQIPSCTPSLFQQDTVFLPASQGTAIYCLADGQDLTDYLISVNDEPTLGISDGSCGTLVGGGGGGTRDAYFYPTFLLTDGPYRIDGWSIGASVVMDVGAANFSDLADSMSVYDPNLDWVYDVNEGGIVASGATGNYFDLILFEPNFGSTLTISLQTITVNDPNGGGGGTFVAGTALELPAAGLYEVVLEAIDGSCGDRLVIFREPASNPSPSVVNLSIIADQVNGPFCVDDSELGGPVESIESCSAPLNGTLTFTSFECFTYTPDPGYVGSDAACVVFCTSNGLICDTITYVFQVTNQVQCTTIWTQDLQTEFVSSCTDPAFVCLPSLPDEFFNYSLVVDGIPRTDALACGADTITIYSYADVAGRGQAGPYAVENYRLASGIYNSTVSDVNALVDSLNQWDPAGSWLLNSTSFTIRGGVNGYQYDTLQLRQITTDTINRLVPVTTLTENQLGLSLDTGRHTIVVVDNSTMCTDTMEVAVVCNDGAPCPDIVTSSGTELEVAECEDAAVFSITSPTTPPSALQLFVNGELVSGAVSGVSLSTTLDTGSYAITILDPVRGCATSFSVSVTCAACVGPIDATNIAAGVNCAAAMYEICLPVPQDELADYAITIDGLPYTGNVGGCDQEPVWIIDYLGLPAAGNAGPYLVDSFSINGIQFTGSFNTAADLVDLLNQWDPSGNWQFDDISQLIIGRNLSTTYSQVFASQQVSGDAVVLDVVVDSITRGSLITIPSGQGVRVLTFDNGVDCIQTVELTVVCTTTEIVFDTVSIGGNTTFCVNQSELNGPIVSLTNACPEVNGVVNFDLSGQPGCVLATGLAPGSAQACLVACDAQGVCDTTFYIVVVNQAQGTVATADDIIRIPKGETAVVSLTANDTFSILTSITIVTSPTRGTAFLNQDGVLTYTPDQDQCGFTDSLVYEICQGSLCAEGTAIINVRCEVVEAYRGFSPNGDGVNETFVIEGILDYPSARVTVYNRWGNLVFTEIGYQNDWDGIWDGKRLISGTYFYLIEIEGESPIAGYVQLNR